MTTAATGDDITHLGLIEQPAYGYPEILTDIIHASAALIEERGWSQGDMYGPGGELCIMAGAHEVKGAGGLASVVREVVAYLEYSEAWNDDPERTQEQVVAALRGITVKPVTLQRVFGVPWLTICDMARDMGQLTPAEIAVWNGKDETPVRHTSDPQERRARGAVADAFARRAQALGMRPNGPAVVREVALCYRRTAVAE